MKHLFNNISKQEKQRILEMHKSATRKNYLFEETTGTTTTNQNQNQGGIAPTPEPCDPNITLKAKVFRDQAATNFYTNIEIGRREIEGGKVRFQFNLAGDASKTITEGYIDCGSNAINIGSVSTFLGPITTKKVTCLCDEYMAKNKGTTSNQA